MSSASHSTGGTGPRTAPVDRCPLCGGADARVLFRASDRLHGIPGTYSYRRCVSCRTVFQDPRIVPEDIGLCYPGEYYTHAPLADRGAGREAGGRPEGPPETLGSLRQAIIGEVRGTPGRGLVGMMGRILARSRFLRQRAFHGLIDELIPRAPVSLRALDVGCGEGSLLTALQRAGWEATGVEWDPRAAEIARRQSGRPVHPGDFRRIDLPGGAYHLVALSHVLEHLGDPVSALRRIEEFLAPGGRAVLLYPNPESLGARVFRDAWFPWEVPRHLVLPSSRALAREAWRAGLTVERIRTTARFAPNFFARSRKYRSARPGEPIDVTVSVLDHAAGLLERLLVALGLNLGEEVVVSLVKPASPEDSIPHAPGTPRG